MEPGVVYYSFTNVEGNENLTDPGPQITCITSGTFTYVSPKAITLILRL